MFFFSHSVSSIHIKVRLYQNQDASHVEPHLGKNTPYQKKNLFSKLELEIFN